ncbi:putative RNA helicase [Trypanosoma rangeli]|uniref:RNA helicase n=1 Tax=Trypanosoma rangeli TaxID=5698 RepID=A0A422NE24_TRYRA|nr:putative RNA helicase [Trypanosoma rangeli]RNF03748.1 putative RNA helicase [Trypanosoma rangeli]|eukprot:RNF03748.1 putative RNA helicase [Trypanosoma rangeli]
MLSRAGRDMIIDVLHHAATGGAVPVPEKHFDANAGGRITLQRNTPLTSPEILQRLYEALGFPPDLTTQYVTDLQDDARFPTFSSLTELLAEDGPHQAFLVRSCLELFYCMLWYSRGDVETTMTAEEGDAVLEDELDTIRSLFDESFLGVKNFDEDDVEDRHIYFSFFTESGGSVVVCVSVPYHYPVDPPLVFVQPRGKLVGALPTLGVFRADTKELPAASRRSILDAAVEAINGLAGEGCLVSLVSSLHGAISSLEHIPNSTNNPHVTEEQQAVKEEKVSIDVQRKAFATALTAAPGVTVASNEGPLVPYAMPERIGLTTVDCTQNEADRVRREYLKSDKSLNTKLSAEWDVLKNTGTMKTAREQLPAFQVREELRETLSRHQVVVIGGETGSGKTTQIPQYLYEFMCEAGMGGSANIVCTQPRRLAATSVALRVAEERDEAVGGVVGYTIRLESCVSRRTQITYCTTGIVLRRLQVEKFLGSVSHIVVDEIHERGVDTDFLLILLRDLIQRRSDLKVVLMSATMDSELFARYFGGAPVISIRGRTYPVQNFYLEDIIPMVSYVLEDGSPYARWEVKGKERRRNTRKQALVIDPEQIEEARETECQEQALAGQLHVSQKTLETISRMNLDVINYELIESIVLYIDGVLKVDGAVLIFLPGMAEMIRCVEQLKSNPRLSNSCLMYNLHSSLGSSEQHGVFQRPPKGKRKVVIGTNIMETSITIDDAVFVIDSGKARENRYDARKSLSQLVTVNVSKANCRQRQGRAGRVREGFCFCLFTSAHFEALDDHQLCEMHRVPLEGLILQIYSLDLGDEVEYLQKALSPPEEHAVRSSVRALTTLGALTFDKRLTSLGHHLANLPLDVRIGKMIIHGAILHCVDPVLTIAACLAVRSPFLSAMDYQTEVEAVRRAFAGEYMSDHLVFWFAYASWIAMQHKEGTSAAKKLCARYYLSIPTLKQIQSTKRQYERYLYEAGFIEETPTQSSHDRFLYNPVLTLDDRVYESGGERFNANAGSVKCILSCVVAGLYPNIARVKTGASKKGGTFVNMTTFDGLEVLIHPSSVAGKAKTFASPLLVYVDKVKTSATFLRDVSMVTPLHVILFSGGGLEYLPKYSELVVDDITAFKCGNEDATLLKHLKDQLDSALSQKINDPTQSWESTSSVVVRAILRLLKDDFESVRHMTVVDHRRPRPSLTAPLAPPEPSETETHRKKQLCFVCGEADHVARFCPRKTASLKGGPSTRCFVCGEWHHPTECVLVSPIQ